MSNRPDIHALVYGHSGTGKTTFASTFPTPGYVSMFDAYGQDEPFLRQGDKVEKSKSTLGVPIKRVWSKKDLLWELHYYHDLEPEEPDAWSLFVQEQRAFKPTEWATWIGDSVTEAIDAALFEQQYIINRKGNQMQWMGGVTTQLSLHFKTRLKSYDCNVVLIAHIAQKFINVPSFQKGVPAQRIDKRVEVGDESESGNTQVLRFLAAPGRLGRDGGLAAQYREVYRMYMTRDSKDRPVARIQAINNDEWIAKSQIHPNPDGCVAEYEALWEEDKPKRKEVK